MQSLPPVYRVLGLAGLLPFFAGPIMSVTGHAPFAALMFPVYSLAIASFLSGTWWGLAVARGSTQIAIAVASNGLLLIAVGALLFAEPALSTAILAAVFVVLFIGEWRIPVLAQPFTGYLKLRATLTILVVFCHIIMLALPRFT